MMMVPGKQDFVVLYQLLIKDGEKRQMKEIIADFNSKIPRSRYLENCSALLNLLDPTVKFLKPAERLVAITIIHSCFPSQSPTNAYRSFLMETANNDDCEKFENAYIHHLLDDTKPEVINFSAAEYIQNFNNSYKTIKYPQQNRPLHDKTRNEPYKLIFKDVAVSNVIPDPDNSSYPVLNNNKNDSELRDEAMKGLLHSSFSSSKGLLYPNWVRPRPPRLPVLDGELVWANPTDINHEPIWDAKMCSPTPQDFLNYIRLHPEKLLALIESNLPKAVKVLSKLINSPEIVNVLLTMDTSLHSVEFVNQLTEVVELPLEFLHFYVMQCVLTCQDGVKDKYMQNRLVRLVCVYLQSLIRDGNINVHELLVEIETERRRIRKAAA